AGISDAFCLKPSLRKTHGSLLNNTIFCQFLGPRIFHQHGKRDLLHFFPEIECSGPDSRIGIDGQQFK
ncbi:MAG TPA: hypothetical protein VHO70_19370, partial [Chitinispirillaceae bacterium]|nr:hypothetical protein [Chitinispirillaceae bacterium]